MAHTYNPSPQEAEAGGLEFEDSLGSKTLKKRTLSARYGECTLGSPEAEAGGFL